ncbi:hypothetical protein A2361_01905 [Candidatus Woesebacteria bacterium RIFOXYB1_FULL_40_26]|uniref:Uncharacterized protein n=1 Tax=Candidatus Woesebacteria bacterium RIFOXYB1_FULL_40_26 TaxID=1802539 RepID=A0A1F8CVY0_9BACT|nr:MAG: hypothetical protein A2361_01905 [Candidatus Woesebacteria bacterium RIFOXYB1_FULL_40_26]
MADGSLSEMNPEEREQKLAELTKASKARAAAGPNLTGTQPDTQEQKELDEAGETWNNEIAAATPKPPSTPKSIMEQRAEPGGEAQKQMEGIYGGRLSTVPKPISETPPLTNPSEKWYSGIKNKVDKTVDFFKNKLGL